MRIIIASLLLVSLPVSADRAKSPPSDAKQMHSDDCAKARDAKRACVLDMTGEDLDGTRPPPPVIPGTVITFWKNSSLIRIRHDFIEQIVKTAEGL